MNTSTYVLALIAGGFTLLNSTSVQKWIDKKINPPVPLEETKKKDLVDALLASTKLDKLTRELALLPGIKIAKILQTNNGGGIPRPGCIIYCSATYPIDQREYFKNVPIDEEVSKYIAKVILNDSIHFKISELKQFGMLQTGFREQGVRDCECFYLRIYADKFFLLSIDFYDMEIFNKNHEATTKYKAIVSQIRNVVNGIIDEE